MAKSIKLTIVEAMLLGQDEDKVNRYRIKLGMAYNEVTTEMVPVQVPNPDWEEGQPDPDDPPQFITEDQEQITTTLIFSGNYPIETIHDGDAFTAALLAVQPRILADIAKYNTEKALAVHPVLINRVSQLEGLLNQ